MKALVCFKIVPDMDMVLPSDWQVDEDGAIDISYANKIINCFDETALEMALRLSENSESLKLQMDITAMTISPNSLDRFFKNIMAIGVNHGVRIDCHDNLDFNAFAIAKIISEYVKSNKGFDLIVMGRQAGVGDNGQTPLIVAEMLGLPCITQVTDINRTAEGLEVTNQIDDGIQKQIITSPVVISVGNTVGFNLRMPTLREKLKASKKEIESLTIADLGLSDKDVYTSKDKTLSRLFEDKVHVTCEIIPGETPRQKAEVLYDKYIKGRMNI